MAVHFVPVGESLALIVCDQCERDLTISKRTPAPVLLAFGHQHSKSCGAPARNSSVRRIPEQRYAS